ncbi:MULTISPECIES: hypothetical protein [unclassified Pseudomonas]|uniref:hypothetical protein n=1 Tax=unclassified Pseudomonas TaxID=196821 RepID=UPI0021C703E6|nr:MULTISPECIES: hypothetical protein [unclassified Pseudomonas]MCU1731401.1 hypothetical protein [Pseudomonas sp. 20P_3.2_Bac4]MCU1746923.1 hypothetical protein [Pseudomonas sp. 20P_3.2_Bac5]
MDGEAITGLLLLFAPADVLDGLELSQENAAAWAVEVDGWDEFHRVEIAALALYYSARKIRKGPEYQGTISVDLNTIHSLVQLAEIEGSGMVNDLVDELKAVVRAKQRATVAKNRERIEKVTWHEKAIALKAKGLAASEIAERLEKSASQVRKVVNKAKKEIRALP